MAMTSLKTHHY